MSNITFTDLFMAKFKNGGRGDGHYDCWGLTMEVFRRFGVELPDFNISCFDSPRINEQVDEQRSDWTRLEAPVAPCLVVMRYDPSRPKMTTHIGTYIGDGKFVHILYKVGVAVNSIHDIAWAPQIEGFYKWNQQNA